jgi:hypothetical protein
VGAYRKFSPHLSLLSKVGIVYLLPNHGSKLEKHRQYLPMRERIRKDVAQKQGTVLPDLVHRVVFQ